MIKKLTFLIMLFLNLLSFAKIKNYSEDLSVKTLDNGMTYYFYKNKRPENRASVNVIIKAGSLQEDENQKGLAHFLEHMAFNGTEKYKKNNIIKYLESIGLDFGGDLNAHTSFYETVYKLKLPTDDKEKFEKGIEILREMMFKASLTQKDIDEEKEIIVEEWRLSQGIRDRVYENIYQEAVFKDSRYEKRKVIGDMEIIKSAKRKNLKDFYDKWYTPQNMAIVVVGDIDKQYLDEMINKYFNSISKSKFYNPEKYSLKELKDKFILFEDEEVKIPEIQIIYRKDRNLIHDENYLKKIVKETLLKNLLGSRYYIEANSKNRGILEAGLEKEDYMKDISFTLYGVLKEGEEKKGIEILYNNLRYLGENEVSKEEIELEKKNIINKLEVMLKNKKSIHNEEIIREISKVFIENKMFFSPDEQLEIFKEYLGKINSQDIKELAKEIYNDNASYVLILPKKEEKIFKDKEEFKKYIDKIKKEELIKDREKSLNLVLKDLGTESGKIVSSIDKGDYVNINLSNNIEVFYKKTDFKKDEVKISLFKEEGSSIENYLSYLNSLMASSMISESGAGNIKFNELNLYMKGKNFRVTPYISPYYQGFEIVSTVEDLEEALKYFTNLLKEPRIEDIIYNKNIETFRTIIKNRKNSSRDVFSDKISEILYNNHPRKKFISEKDLEKISKEQMLKVYKDKFNNFNNYKMVVVGSIKYENLKNILEKYFAGLSNHEEDKGKAKGYEIKHPSGIVKEEVKKGTDKKILVNIFYPIKVKYSQENKKLAETVAKVAEIKLIEEIREKMAGVYGINVKILMDKFEPGLLIINYSTAPSKEEDVFKAVKKEIEKINKGLINENTLKSVRENYRNVYENNQKENIYWEKYLENKAIDKDKYRIITPEIYNELTNNEDLKIFSNRFIQKNNFIKILLKPEKYQ